MKSGVAALYTKLSLPISAQKYITVVEQQLYFRIYNTVLLRFIIFKEKFNNVTGKLQNKG